MNRTIPTILTALVVALSTAGPIAGQDAARVRAEATLPSDVFARLDEMARGAAREGIPADALYNKALEGAAKGVPADRLVPALEGYAGRLRQASQAFGGMAPAPLVVAGADALQRGVGPELLRGLGRDDERSPMAVLVLADLVESGVGNEHALALVREAMQRRAHEQQMLDMPAEVRRLMRQGHSAQDAVDQVRRGLMRHRGGGMTPPVAPGSEPMAWMQRRMGG